MGHIFSTTIVGGKAGSTVYLILGLVLVINLELIWNGCLSFAQQDLMSHDNQSFGRLSRIWIILVMKEIFLVLSVHVRQIKDNMLNFP